MRNELGSDHLTNKGSEVRGNCVHSLSKIVRELITEVDLLNNTLCELLDLDNVTL